KEIIDLPQEEAGYKRLLKNVENIKFQDITFSYKGENLFENLSIFINKGEKVAFVGESGVGKTTLISLLKRNLSPILGKVLINNEILTNIKKEDYIDKIGVVDQNEHIINDTLIENMRIINREATDEDIEKALNLACLEDVVNKLENKKETLLGEGGVNLSSGQKQRIALARLFLKNPDVVFLDEATSALDNILENKIIKNINERFKDKIIISVAHRLNTLKEFDKIFVLGKKGIIEVGNFEQLLLNKGIFYKMYMGDEKA
ncbi:ABC transporter ATP-binding protein, partial [uncultured Cetobacterium sp.]